MENEKEKRQPKKQCFYFNENGQLVVESNKGVWVDGEKFVKMYGDFVCNAKTLGIIIEKFKGFPVVIEETKVEALALTIKTSAIVNPSDEDKGLLSKIERYEARNENMGVQVKNLKEEIKEKQELAQKYYLAIDNFNKLPWRKRIFKKIEVK